MNSKMLVRIFDNILNEWASETMRSFKTVTKVTNSLRASPVILKKQDFLSEKRQPGRMHSFPSSTLNRLQQIGQYKFEP